MSGEPCMAASPAYAVGQLQRAIDGLAAARDAAGLAGAESKIARWRSVLAGMAGGGLSAGSRTPVSGTPAWVTLEVAHGGFATGRLLAEQPLEAGERELLAGLPPDVPGLTGRERLNLWFTGDAGQRDLLRVLAEGRYRVEVPEEAALLVVAWLLEHGQFEVALDLVAELRPWMSRLRFTPRPAAGAAPSGVMVHVQTAGEVAAALNAIRPRPQIAVMRETLGVQYPLFDRLVALWCDTVDGDLPRLAPGSGTDGHGHRRVAVPALASRLGPAPQSRGWPTTGQAAEGHDLAGQPPGRQEQLRAAAGGAGGMRARQQRADRPGGGLDPPGAGQHDHPARRAGLARADQPAGDPAAGSPRRPGYADLARVVAARARPVPRRRRDPVAGRRRRRRRPCRGVRGGPGRRADPGAPGRQGSRALEAPAGELVERGIIGSAEVLAAVVPQITAQVLAGGMEDPALSGLYGQAYAAFRQRRTCCCSTWSTRCGSANCPGSPPCSRTDADSTDAARAARQAWPRSRSWRVTRLPADDHAEPAGQRDDRASQPRRACPCR